LKAVGLVADDDLSDVEIADQCGIGRTTLHRWKKHPEFEARRRSLVADLAARARSEGLGRLDKRMARYGDRHQRMSDVIDARAKEMAGEIAGSDTGLLVRQLKHVTVRYEMDPNSPKSETITTREEHYEYAVDTGLLRELREIEKQVSVEVGDCIRKLELAGTDGGPITIVFAEREGPS